ncbi:hypothetical protein TGAMA5MH_03820 [Trichoderma gamsii]|nr:hypothetical protein TGAMA5MH_03820 [Trichoderma gamsii]
MTGGSFFLLVFYLPVWFQGVQGQNAVDSGIHNLPLILGVIIASLLAGGAVTALGYYTPFMILSTILSSVGVGLLTTFKVDTPSSQWIGYQALIGIGSGLGRQQTMVAAQTVLPLTDVAIGSAVMVFSQSIGGSVFLSAGQSVFNHALGQGVRKFAAGLDPTIVTNTGATALRNVIEPKFLPGVIRAYNDAVVQTFYVSLACACATVVGSLLIEWKSVKEKADRDGTVSKDVTTEGNGA